MSPGINAGDQKLADGGLGRHAVDHHRDARRDQDIKGRADADRAGGKFVRIAVTAHFRHRDLGHHRRRGSARAGHGAEDAAGEDGGDRKPALDVRAPVARRGVKVARESARGGEKCHQDEHRDRRQGVIRHRAEWSQADDPHHLAEIAGNNVDAEHAGTRERDRDRHAEDERKNQQHKRKRDHVDLSAASHGVHRQAGGASSLNRYDRLLRMRRRSMSMITVSERKPRGTRE